MAYGKAASALLVVFVFGLSACAPRGPVVGSGTNAPDVGGTIAGKVSLAPDNAPLAGRKVTAVNLASGERVEATTAVNGGYTMKVPMGRYRMELELQPRETLTQQPPEFEIKRSDLDSSRDFVVAVK